MFSKSKRFSKISTDTIPQSSSRRNSKSRSPHRPQNMPMSAIQFENTYTLNSRNKPTTLIFSPHSNAKCQPTSPSNESASQKKQRLSSPSTLQPATAICNNLQLYQQNMQERFSPSILIPEKTNVQTCPSSEFSFDCSAAELNFQTSNLFQISSPHREKEVQKKVSFPQAFEKENRKRDSSKQINSISTQDASTHQRVASSNGSRNSNCTFHNQSLRKLRQLREEQKSSRRQSTSPFSSYSNPSFDGLLSSLKAATPPPHQQITQIIAQNSVSASKSTTPNADASNIQLNSHDSINKNDAILQEQQSNQCQQIILPEHERHSDFQDVNPTERTQFLEKLIRKDEEIIKLKEELSNLKQFYTSKDRCQQDYLNNILKEHLQSKHDLTSLTTQMSSMIQSIENLKQENINHQSTIQILKAQLTESSKLLELQHDQIVQFRGNLRIFCRVKPPPIQSSSLELPTQQTEMECVDRIQSYSTNNNTVRVNPQHKQVVEIVGEDNSKFFFDHVFDTSSDQEEVFRETAPFIQSALNGDQVSIIAYGQTGSGKTYTMEGASHELNLSNHSGILPRAAVYLFKEKDRVTIHKNLVFVVGVVEIYCEELRDLLQQDERIQQKLQIVQQNNRIKVLHQTFIKVSCAEELLKIIAKTSTSRVSDRTTQNAHSSRSHCIVQVKIFENEIEKGSLSFVDLAGSESFQATSNKRESSFINKSLTTLKRIVTLLSDKTQQNLSKIPYRESKLTRLLQDSLGGNSKTLIYVTVCPSQTNFCQTKESLKFISKATL